MRKKTALLLLLIPFLCHSRDVLTPERLFELLEEDNPGWETADLTLKSSEMDKDVAELGYGNYWAVTPEYSLEFADPNAQIGGLTLSYSRLLPSNGTLGISLSDYYYWYQSAGNTLYTPGLSLGLSFEQPLLTGGKLIEGRAYEAARRTETEIPLSMARIQHRMSVNTLISEKLGEYYELLLKNEEYLLREREQELTEEELTHLSSLRERGLYSGTDYWKMQLDAEQGKDELLDSWYSLESSRKELFRSLGLEEGKMELPRLTIDRASLIPLPPAKEDFFLSNSDWELSRLQEERYRLTAEGALTQTATTLTLGLNLSSPDVQYPYYAVDGSTPFGDWFLPDSRMDTTLSLSMTYSPAKGVLNKRAREKEEIDARIARINREEKERELLTRYDELRTKEEMLTMKLDRIEESIVYQKMLLEKEEKLLNLSSSTPLAVRKAGLNVNMRELDRKSTLIQLCRNRLEILTLTGGDFTDIDAGVLPGGER